MEGTKLDEKYRDLIGRIAATRATLAWGRQDAETIIEEKKSSGEEDILSHPFTRTPSYRKQDVPCKTRGRQEFATRAYHQKIKPLSFRKNDSLALTLLFLILVYSAVMIFKVGGKKMTAIAAGDKI